MFVDPNIVLRVAEKSLDLALKIHDDIPPEERRKHWERWGKFWDGLWAWAEKVEKPDA